MKTNIRIIVASASLCLVLPTLAVLGAGGNASGLLPMARTLSLPLQAAAAAGTDSDPVEQAQDLIDGGHYDDGIAALKAIVAKDGRSADSGANASYALVAAYRNHGDYSASISEAKLLLPALPKEPYANSDSDLPKHSEVTEVIGTDTAVLKKINGLKEAAATSHSAAFRAAVDGDIAGLSNDLTGADDYYVKAYSLLSQEPSASQSVKYFVDRRYLVGYPTNLSFDKRLAGRVGLCRSILHETSASPARQVMALQFLNRTLQYIADPKRKSVNTASLSESEYIKLLAPCMAATDKALLNEVHIEMLRYTALGHAKLAQDAEAAGNWRKALAEYQTILKSFDPSMSRLIYSDWPLHDPIEAGEEAARSAKYLNGITDPSVNNGPCSFLGVDHTIGSDWQGVVGHEAWALFAIHGGDECGGPALLDGAFSYKPMSGDVRNWPRRWRDPVDFPHRASDIPLVDPLSSGVPVYSFLDDNGEQYRLGNGPDMYISLKIPAGRHILSFPIHFSYAAPEVKVTDKLHYGIVLDQQIGNSEKCVAAGTISADDEPGYARMAVTGPANYTLVVFRADSLNANLPAIFLDPDLRSQTPPSLAEAFSTTEMALPSDEPVTSALKKFNVLKNQYQAGTLNPHSQNWSQLQTQAHAAASDKTLDTTCRIVAAYIEWRSAERCPLHNGAIETAFREYVALKYGTS